MPARLLALLLLVVVLWSGTSSPDALRDLAQPSVPVQPAAALAGGLDASQDGLPLQQHQLDGLPLQALSDPPTESPGLLTAAVLSSAPCLVMAQPVTAVSDASGPPFLAGPLRPPCGATPAG